MATGGRSFKRSVKDSDIYYDFPCSTCEKDGKNVEAIKFCCDCDENLCGTCLIHHNKFAVTRGHRVLDQVQTRQGQTKQIPTQRCSQHGGKVIDVYCPDHDTVGCSTCFVVDHSSCKGKRYIPDVATGIKTSQNFKQLENNMITLKLKLESLMKRKRDNVHRLKQDKADLIKEIHVVRKKMNEQLDRMEKTLVAEAEKKFKESIDSLQNRIKEVDGMLDTIKQVMDTMRDGDNDADIFVSSKIIQREMSDKIQPMLERFEKQRSGQSYNLHIDENAKLIMNETMMLASIQETIFIEKADHQIDVDIRVSNDENICKVLFMSTLPDGCIVMSDYKNKNLKKLDPVSFDVTTLVNLPDNPSGVCLVDNTRLAVGLINQKKIKFVSLSGRVKLTSGFSVGDRCRGLDHCDGLLYVCCGGSPEKKEEERGHVEVYNCVGELLKCLYEGFTCPAYISVVNYGGAITMYTSDHSKGVQVRGIDGIVQHTYPTVLESDLPFCVLGGGQLCIGESKIGDINLHTRMNKRLMIGYNQLNGYPEALYFDELNSRLYVIPDVDDEDEVDWVLKVFDLKM